MIRQPAVAGQFYPSSSSKLSSEISGYTRNDLKREKAIGIVSPHAGIIYSGQVAGEVYSRIKIPDTFVIMGPNHHLIGSDVAVMSSGSWQIPTGALTIDENLAQRLIDKIPLISEDSFAHTMEHSLEVQTPFVLQFSSNVKIVPIVMAIDSLDSCRDIGESMADVIREIGYEVTIIASSDMSHYVSDSTARAQDGMAIERMTDLDPEGLYRTVRKEGISMCGVIPATTMLFAAKKLGATDSTLVKYMTSGEVSGDFEQVVGYAGIIVK